MVADLVPPADRPRAYGLLFWAINLGFSIAMVVGGVLAQRGFIWLFWADALTCVGFGLLVLRAVPETRPRSRRHRQPGVDPGAAARPGDAGDRSAWPWSTRSSTARPTAGLPLAMQQAGFKPAAYGITVAVNGIVIVCVQPLVLNWLSRLDHSRVIALGQLLVGVGFGLTQLAVTVPEYMATVVVWTLGEIATATLMSALVADLAPRQMRGRYQGMLGMAWGGGGLIGPFAGAWVLQNAGGRLALVRVRALRRGGGGRPAPDRAVGPAAPSPARAGLNRHLPRPGCRRRHGAFAQGWAATPSTRKSSWVPVSSIWRSASGVAAPADPKRSRIAASAAGSISAAVIRWTVPSAATPVPGTVRRTQGSRSQRSALTEKALVSRWTTPGGATAKPIGDRAGAGASAGGDQHLLPTVESGEEVGGERAGRRGGLGSGDGLGRPAAWAPGAGWADRP